jgi:PAS domain S-box-containing protein
MSFAFCGLENRNFRVVQRPLGAGIREQVRLWPCALTVFVFILSLPVIQGVAAAQVPPTRRILILSEANPSFPSTTIIFQGIQTALSHLPYHVEYYTEYFDTGLFPDPAVQQGFRDFYLRKYRNRQPDVIITVGTSSLKFMQEVHQTAFPGVPIVFCLPIGDAPSARELGSDFTGVETDMAPAETLKIALRLQPGTQHVVVTGGVGDWDKHEQALLKQQIKRLTDHLEISYMTDVAVPELPEHLKHLPPHTLVLLLSYANDVAGIQYKSSETGPLVAAAANAPVFSLYDVFLNHGEVGGYLSNVNEQGKVAGSMALRILRGEKPQDIPRVKGVNTYMFDWRAVKRWGLKESEIPPGSIVLNRQPTVWESYKGYIIGGISLISLEALLIGELLWQRTRRRKVEANLVVTNDRLRLSLEAGTSVGWEWDVRSGRDRWFGDLQTMFGIPADSYEGRPEDFYRFVYPEDRERVGKAVADARKSRNPYMSEFRIVRTDGTVRWISARGTFYYAKNGDPERMLGMAVDITERKQAEEALASIGRRLIEAHEEERTWIARELHDDFNQRIAMLTIDLEQWGKQLPDSAVEFRDHISHVRERLLDMANDIQALSHRLHSSKLEYLGIVAAARGFCRELSEQQKVEIDFSHTDIPDGVPKEISLCLFRVLQEALQNAVKHSGVRQFAVELNGIEQEIQLTVSDQGVGFDPRDAIESHGLGLISMRERLHLAGGRISIESQPGSGATIHARVPFNSLSDSVMADRIATAVSRMPN